MFGKILVFELCQKILSANQIATFFKFEYLLNYMRYQLDFLHADRDPSILQNDHAVIVWEVQVWLWAWSGIFRHAQSEPK